MTETLNHMSFTHASKNHAIITLLDKKPVYAIKFSRAMTLQVPRHHGG